MKLVPCLAFLVLACASRDPAPEASSRETAAVWIARGRAELERGDPASAEGSFQRAAELEPEAFEPRLWTLRAWMDQGRSNDMEVVDHRPMSPGFTATTSKRLGRRTAP